MDKPKIGLLGLTLEFYEQLAPQLRSERERFVREKLIPALSPVAEVRFERAVCRREDVERMVAGFENDGLDAVLVVLLTYAPSLIAARALKQTRLPVIIWNTQELYAVDDSYDDAALLANHGVHGVQDLCNVLTRERVPFYCVSSHLEDSAPLGELPDLFQAARAVNRLRRMRIGQLGYGFPGMGDFGMDTTHLANSLGCTCQPLSISEFIHRAADAEPKQVKTLVDEYRGAYEVANAVTQEDMQATARAEIALRGLIQDYRLDAFTYQFLAFGQDDRTETLPFVAASRLLAEGIGFGGEGDVISAVHSAVANILLPPAGFSEVFTVDFAGNGLLLSHMGEANAAMAAPGRKIRLVRRPAPIVPIRGNQLALVFSYQRGEATLSTLTLTAGQRWRIIAAAVRVEDFGPLEHLAVPHSKIHTSLDVRDFLNAYFQAGGPHHLALGFGDARKRLSYVAKLLDADYVEI